MLIHDTSIILLEDCVFLQNSLILCSNQVGEIRSIDVEYLSSCIPIVTGVCISPLPCLLFTMVELL